MIMSSVESARSQPYLPLPPPTANLVRSAKPGNNWMPNDLRSYNISLNEQLDPLQFFGLQEFPRPSVGQELVEVCNAADMQEGRHAELINLLDLTMTPDEGEHPVIDFTIKLLDVLGYSRRDRVARTKMTLGFLTCGERRYAEPDICIFDCSRGEVLAIVQVYKRLQLDMLDGTKSQLVAGAVAAFDENNAMRGEYSLRPLSQMVIPGIVMNGTSPIFFKIPITQELSDLICEGAYPPEETHVEFCYPPVPRPAPHNRYEEMKPLENRREILKFFEAFKAIVGI